MASLTDLIKQRRRSGVGVGTSISQSLKEKLKEKIDPRKFLNQSGLLTALFPNLKAYKAKEMKNISFLSKIVELEDYDIDGNLSRIEFNTKLTSKNTGYLNGMAKDANVMKSNIISFVKLITGSFSETPDMFFQKQQEREKLFESKFENEKKVHPIKDKEKKPFNWLKMITSLGTVAVSGLILDFLIRKDDSFIMKAYNKIKEYLKTQYDIFEKNLLSLKKKTIGVFNETIDNVSGLFSFNNISEYIGGDKNPFEEYDEILNNSKQKLEKIFKEFSFFPEAQAATLERVTSKQNISKSVDVSLSTAYTTESNLSEGKSRLLDKISMAEGTSDTQAQQKGFNSGYDVTLGYGKFHRATDKPLSQMTVGEVKNLQSEMLRNPKNTFNSSAAGKYQIVRKTLVGLQKKYGFSDQQTFSPEFQDYLAMKLMEGRGLSRIENVTEKYKRGLISETEYQKEVNKFQNNLSREWASIATTNTNSSFYGQPTGIKTPQIQYAIKNAFIESSQNTSNVENVSAVDEDLMRNISSVSAHMLSEELMQETIIKTIVVENNNSQVLENQKGLAFKTDFDATESLIDYLSRY